MKKEITQDKEVLGISTIVNSILLYIPPILPPQQPNIQIPNNKLQCIFLMVK